MPYNTTGEDIKAINICYVLMRVFHIEETTVVMGSVTSAPAAGRQEWKLKQSHINMRL